MMYRSDWAIEQGQEVVLAVRITRSALDEILKKAVYSTFEPEIYETHDLWKSEVARSDVRLQWDPDHSPSGGKLERRAIQLGLRGSVLAKYAREWIVSITNITDFVESQRENAISSRYEQLIIPQESVYPVSNEDVIHRLQLQHYT